MTQTKPLFVRTRSMQSDTQWLLASYHIQDFGVKGLSALALSENKKWDLLREKLNQPNIKGLFYLQTCNRIEYLYCLSSADTNGNDLNSYLPALTSRVKTDLNDIIDHLLSVCLSKDSLVFGESQILGQFKRSYAEAKEENFLNKDLNNLIQWVLKEAKQIRNHLPFKHFHSSISVLAAQAVQLDHNTEAKILFVGSGETNEIAARYLSKNNFKNLHFVNRSFSKAKALADALHGTAHTWEQTANLNNIDVVICATTSKEILIDKEKINQWKIKTAVDLSVPANISKEDCLSAGINHYDVSNFQHAMERVKDESNEFLLNLQKCITEAKHRIFSNWQIHTSSKLFTQFKKQQDSWMKEVMEEIRESDIEEKVTESIEKKLKKICHQQIIELRKSIEQNEIY